jgi:hypothetical protein
MRRFVQNCDDVLINCDAVPISCDDVLIKQGDQSRKPWHGRGCQRGSVYVR